MPKKQSIKKILSTRVKRTEKGTFFSVEESMKRTWAKFYLRNQK